VLRSLRGSYRLFLRLQTSAMKHAGEEEPELSLHKGFIVTGNQTIVQYLIHRLTADHKLKKTDLPDLNCWPK